MKIPIIVHDPKRFENGARVEVPVSQLDILPTIADLLGYEIDGGAYQGISFLGPPLPEDRLLKFSCWAAEQCLPSIEGTKKYIYHTTTTPMNSSTYPRTRWRRRTWRSSARKMRRSDAGSFSRGARESTPFAGGCERVGQKHTAEALASFIFVEEVIYGVDLEGKGWILESAR